MLNCTWQQFKDRATWKTHCGNVFDLANDDTLAENGFQYCPYCGGVIDECKDAADWTHNT